MIHSITIHAHQAVLVHRTYTDIIDSTPTGTHPCTFSLHGSAVRVARTYQPFTFTMVTEDGNPCLALEYIGMLSRLVRQYFDGSAVTIDVLYYLTDSMFMDGMYVCSDIDGIVRDARAFFKQA